MDKLDNFNRFLFGLKQFMVRCPIKVFKNKIKFKVVYKKIKKNKSKESLSKKMENS